MKKNDEKTLTEKIQTFFNTNNWIIAGGIIFTFVYLSFKVGGVLDEVKKSEEVIKKDIGKVVVLTNDGRVFTIDKQIIPYADKRIANYISNLIETHLIEDLVSISKGFKVSYKNPEDLIENYKPFKDFQKYFLNKRWLKEYAQRLILLISADNYPEYINPYDKKINQFVILDEKKNQFKIDITYKVIKRSYLRELTTPNKFRTTYAEINLKAKGFFNPVKYGSFNNPFGLKFTNIQINLLTKR